MRDKRDTVRKGVLEILENDERARNSDAWLIWRFIREKDGIDMFIPFEDFEKMTSFETIRRIRQHIQNTEHKILPTDVKVRNERNISYQEWVEWLRRAKYIYNVRIPEVEE